MHGAYSPQRRRETLTSALGSKAARTISILVVLVVFLFSTPLLYRALHSTFFIEEAHYLLHDGASNKALHPGEALFSEKLRSVGLSKRQRIFAMVFRDRRRKSWFARQ